MSKKLVSILLLLLILDGCNSFGPKYKVGDCAQQSPTSYCEKWEYCGSYVFKILEIGVTHYRTAFISPMSPLLGVMNINPNMDVLDHSTSKTPCPNILKDVK